MPLEVFMDDVVQLRKSHPCGNDQWRVVRLGADIGLRWLVRSRRSSFMVCGHKRPMREKDSRERVALPFSSGWSGSCMIAASDSARMGSARMAIRRRGLIPRWNLDEA